MSLEPIVKKKSINEITAGVHLLCISDMNLLKYPDGKVHKIDGFPAIVVQYKDGKNKTHEQMYLIDGDFREKAFNKMLQSAQVPLTNGKPKKDDAIGKRLWAAIKELHYIDDDVVIQNADTGKPKIEYYIFKVYPFIEGGKKPRILGDPEDNEGIATQEFLGYKNVSGREFVDEMQPYQSQETKAINIQEVQAPKAAKAVEPVAPVEEEMPMFDEESIVKETIVAKTNKTTGLNIKNKTFDEAVKDGSIKVSNPEAMDDEIPNF